MIKTPVSKGEMASNGTWPILNADGIIRFHLNREEDVDQIVSALNAQQPKCKTCGGSGRRKWTVTKDWPHEYTICHKCKGTGIEPDCPAEPSGDIECHTAKCPECRHEFVNCPANNLEIKLEQAAARIEYDKDTLGAYRTQNIRYHARISALEKACESIAKNTCCETCQEAALVAKAALKEQE